MDPYRPGAQGLPSRIEPINAKALGQREEEDHVDQKDTARYAFDIFNQISLTSPSQNCLKAGQDLQTAQTCPKLFRGAGGCPHESS